MFLLDSRSLIRWKIVTNTACESTSLYNAPGSRALEIQDVPDQVIAMSRSVESHRVGPYCFKGTYIDRSIAERYHLC